MAPGRFVEMDWGVFCSYVTILILGVLGNAVVIALTLKSSGQRISPVDLLISSLSLANLCSVLTRCAPVLLCHVYGARAVRAAFCKVFGFFSVHSGCMSAWLTVLLSAYRTLKLCTAKPPLLLRVLERAAPMKICLATVWITWAFLLSPTFMYFQQDTEFWNWTSHGNESQRNVSSSRGNIRRYYGCALAIGHSRKEKVYLYSCVILCEILPAALMLAASATTLRALIKYKTTVLAAEALQVRRTKVNNWVGPAPCSRSKARQRAGWLVLALVSTYLTCWATHFTVLAVSFHKAYQLAPAIITTGRMAYALYPMLCPYGLGLGSRKFQVALRDFTCGHCTKDDGMEA